jgi:long-subunit fatty acid transport protein
MQHKALRLFIFFALVFSAAFQASAQNLTKSPYSILGIGEMQFLGTALQSSMGQTGQGFRRPADVNTLNPASYSALKFTVIDAGMTYGLGTLKQGGSSSNIDNLSFSYFNIAIPLSLKQNIGMAFGLTPYSNIGYNVSTKATYPDFEATTLMSGTGGLSRFYAGAGAQVLKFDSARSSISVGFNASYIFGRMNTEQTLLIPSVYNKFNLAETRSRIVDNIQLQGGVQYQKDFNRGTINRREQYSFVLGAAYTMGVALKGKQEYFIRSMGVGQTTGIRDTIAYDDSNKGSVELPFSFSTGFSFEKKENWMVAMDVNYTNWSDYRSFGSTDSLKNTLAVSLGGSYIPNSSDLKNYFKRVEYRAGARYDNGNLVLAGKDIVTYGVSAGVGLPLGTKTRSKLNISAEYFVRGTSASNLIREEYFRVIFGINFSDRWFQRYKYD